MKHFWADSEYLGKINTKKKKPNFFFQCLALPKAPQSFGSQNLRCPFSVSQYYRRRRLCAGHYKERARGIFPMITFLKSVGSTDQNAM